MINAYIARIKQEGAALVEFSFSILLFLIVVFGIAEFSILVLNVSRANELTRESSRLAIIGSPVCDIFGGSCPGPASELVCPGGTAVTVNLDQGGGGSCAADSPATVCRMFNNAQAILPNVTASQVEVVYACSNAGYSERPVVIPLITVSLRNYTHQFMFAGLLGIDAGIDIPDFEVTRTGEDLYTEREL